MRHRVELFFDLPTATAEAIELALAPEQNVSEVPRSRADVSQVPNGVRILLEADDLPTLRAAVNSYLRWVDAARKAADLGRA